MLLQPKNRKFRKEKKRTGSGRSLTQGFASSHRLEFGTFGLKALSNHLITAAQIETVRRVMIRQVRKLGIIIFRIYPWKPITSKPLKTRMGKGKGSVQFWATPVKAGQVLFELKGAISEALAKSIITQASQKLPLPTKFIAYGTPGPRN